MKVLETILPSYEMPFYRLIIELLIQIKNNGFGGHSSPHSRTRLLRWIWTSWKSKMICTSLFVHRPIATTGRQGCHEFWNESNYSRSFSYSVHIFISPVNRFGMTFRSIFVTNSGFIIHKVGGTQNWNSINGLYPFRWSISSSSWRYSPYHLNFSETKRQFPGQWPA